jgi:hypothetical protein
MATRSPWASPSVANTWRHWQAPFEEDVPQEPPRPLLVTRSSEKERWVYGQGAYAGALAAVGESAGEA